MSRHRAVLVTGTDTAIGKTTVTCAVASALHARGMAVGVLKPVETDCPAGEDGELLPQDGRLLRYFSATELPLADVCPVRFDEPLAPSVAARRRDTTIDIRRIESVFRATAEKHDITFVEGAGGLLVPITDNLDFAGLAREWDLPVLVVVGNRLGALNHALLTVRHARELGLRVIGYVVNTLASKPDVASSTNVDVLAELLGPPLGVVPHLPPLTLDAALREHLAAQAEATVDLDRLLAALDSPA